jgi:general secretion pathway protein F/type IV pilus assembly protein PilC
MARRVSHAKLSRWYQQLSQQTGAGVGLTEALPLSAGPPPDDLATMANRLQRGESVDSVLEEAPRWLPTADRYLLSAASQSGRLAEVTAQLATQHRALAEQRKALLSAIVYPVVVLHFAVISLPLSTVVAFDQNGGLLFDSTAYATRVGGALILFWGLIALLNFAAQRLPRLVAHLCHFLPGIRKYSRSRALARFAWSLEALLNAGVPIQDAFGGAALIADDPRLTPALLDRLPELQRGMPPSQLLERVKPIPTDFLALYQTGERTGQLDVTLERLSQHYEAEARDGLKWATSWYPKILFFVISLAIGAAVSKVFAGYLEFIEGISEW